MGVARNVTRYNKSERFCDPIKVGGDVGVSGVKLRVAHRHGDVLVA